MNYKCKIEDNGFIDKSIEIVVESMKRGNRL